MKLANNLTCKSSQMIQNGDGGSSALLFQASVSFCVSVCVCLCVFVCVCLQSEWQAVSERDVIIRPMCLTGGRVSSGGADILRTGNITL